MSKPVSEQRASHNGTDKRMMDQVRRYLVITPELAETLQLRPADGRRPALGSTGGVGQAAGAARAPKLSRRVSEA